MPLPTDNVPVTPGSGIIVAADGVSDPDLGDVLEQIIKVADGRTNGTDRWKINPDHSADVTVVSSTLPTGAASETTLAEIGVDIDSIETTVATLATESTLSEIGADVDAIETNTGHITDASQKSQVVDGSGNVIGSTGNALDINIKSGGISGFATETTLSDMRDDVDNIETYTSRIPALGQAVSSASTPVVLPAAQITTLTPPAAITNYANESGGHLANIDTTLTEVGADLDAIETSVSNIPPQGQALAAASLPVVLTAIQVSTLTPPAALTNFANETGGNLDAIKSDLDTINTTITEISADIDTIETNSTTIAGAITSSKMATTAADGDYVTFGTKADAAITDATTTNTHMSFLKGLVKTLSDVWDSGNHRLNVFIQNTTLAVTQSGNWSTRTQDGSGTAITSTGAALDINIKSGNPTSITANAGTNLNTSALALESGGHLATVDTSTAAASTTLGGTADAIVAAGATGSLSAKLRRATQGLADLLTGIVLAAGTNIIGKVGIDQATPGTTDSVSVATGQGAGATIGTTSGAAVVSDASGTLQQYLRGLVKIFASVWDSTNTWLNVRCVKKDTYAAPIAFIIAMNSLGIGSSRQATMITSNTNEHAMIHIAAKTGASPTANTTVDVFLIRSDGTYADDSAGGSDAAITIVNATKLGSIQCLTTAANQVLIGSFDTIGLGSLGSNWTIAVTNNTGQALNASNNTATYELIS